MYTAVPTYPPTYVPTYLLQPTAAANRGAVVVVSFGIFRGLKRESGPLIFNLQSGLVGTERATPNTNLLGATRYLLPIFGSSPRGFLIIAAGDDFFLRARESRSCPLHSPARDFFHRYAIDRNPPSQRNTVGKAFFPHPLFFNHEGAPRFCWNQSVARLVFFIPDD